MAQLLMVVLLPVPGVGVVDAPYGVHGDGRVNDAGSPDASELDTDSD